MWGWILFLGGGLASMTFIHWYLTQRWGLGARSDLPPDQQVKVEQELNRPNYPKTWI